MTTSASSDLGRAIWLSRAVILVEPDYAQEEDPSLAVTFLAMTFGRACGRLKDHLQGDPMADGLVN